MKKIISFAWALSLLATPFASANGQLESLSATAAPNRSENTMTIQGTAYAELVDMFQKATDPVTTEIKGWTTGRCFYTTAQDTAVNGLLVATTVVTGGDKGPLFPPTAIMKIIHMVAGSEGPSYFDEMNSETANLVANSIPSIAETVTEAVNVDGGMASRALNGNLEYRIRRSGNMLFEKSVIVNTTDSYKAGDVYAYCYYFKKVRE